MNIYKLRSIIRKKKITLKELSKISGVSLSTLNNILYGETKSPSINTMHKIACALNCTLNDFTDFARQDELLDNDALEIKEMLKDKPELKTLLYVAKDVNDEDLLVVTEVIKRLKRVVVN